jgi:hypothetical protein
VVKHRFTPFTRPLFAFACLVSTLVILVGAAAPAGAQQFTFSLEKYKPVRTNALGDTLPDLSIDQLKLGQYHRVPNFLPWDFSREREVIEFTPDGRFRIAIHYPNIYTFGHEETRVGAFIVIEPRDLSVPGLRFQIDPVDEIAQKRFEESRREVWRKAVVKAVTEQERGPARGGPLNINIPVPLPGAVEKIIGQGEKSNIDISGRESITFAGETRRVKPFIGVEGQQKQPLFPALDLKQELDVRLNGRVGEKINVQVDHSSSSLAQDANRIRLNYQGFEDDVVQLIELGNTSLSLPGSQLVSFSTQSKGLFGIKGLAQVGPVDLTVIASKEEGETSSATFTPRGGTVKPRASESATSTM